MKTHKWVTILSVAILAIAIFSQSTPMRADLVPQGCPCGQYPGQIIQQYAVNAVEFGPSLFTLTYNGSCQLKKTWTDLQTGALIPQSGVTPNPLVTSDGCTCCNTASIAPNWAAMAVSQIRTVRGELNFIDGHWDFQAEAEELDQHPTYGAIALTDYPVYSGDWTVEQRLTDEGFELDQITYDVDESTYSGLALIEHKVDEEQIYVWHELRDEPIKHVTVQQPNGEIYHSIFLNQCGNIATLPLREFEMGLLEIYGCLQNVNGVLRPCR